MSTTLDNMTQAFSGYFRTAEPADLLFWVFLLGPLIAIWLISIIALSSRREGFQSEGRKGILRRQYKVWESVIVVGSVTAAILVGIYVTLWTKGFYIENNYQLPHLLSVLTCGIAPVMALLNLRGVTSRGDTKNFVKQPVTQKEEQAFIHSARQSFHKLKLALLLPFLGFLPLLFKSSPSNLVSFVFDVSTSMESPNQQGEIPLETGKTALLRTVTELTPSTDVIISIFEESGTGGRVYKNSIPEILNARQSIDLTGLHQLFKGAERQSALSYIRSLGNTLTESTPLYETIWSNFLFQREMTTGKTYANKIAVYITDGFDNIQDTPTGFFCENVEFASFYSQEYPVHLINLSEGFATKLSEKIETCGYQVWDGFDSRQFNTVLNQVLKKFKEDWAFILWLMVMCAIVALAGAIIIPKSR